MQSSRKSIKPRAGSTTRNASFSTTPKPLWSQSTFVTKSGKSDPAFISASSTGTKRKLSTFRSNFQPHERRTFERKKLDPKPRPPTAEGQYRFCTQEPDSRHDNCTGASGTPFRSFLSSRIRCNPPRPNRQRGHILDEQQATERGPEDRRRKTTAQRRGLPRFDHLQLQHSDERSLEARTI